MGEDKQVAKLAIVVTGLVGLLGPVITWAATRDSQNSARATARQVQTLAARQDTAKSELAALRVALDRALGELNTLEARAKDKVRLWGKSSNPPTEVQAAQAGLAQAFIRARGHNLRLRVRLGLGDPIYANYDAALYDFGRVGALTRIYIRRTQANRQRAAALITEAVDRADKSIDAAFRRVRARVK
jgi:hypothetical protein